MGSQPSQESTNEESKNQTTINKKQRTFSEDYNSISQKYGSSNSRSEIRLQDDQTELYEEEVSISDVIKQIIQYSIPAFLGVLIRRLNDTI